tara:strand:- start:6274 stop:6849 length:576 start_codon:yes stop_codon:yes gene_type:complete
MFISRFFTCFYLAICLSSPVTALAVEKSSPYKTIEWTDLLPKADLLALMAPPEELNNIEDGSLDDQLSSQVFNALSLAGDSRYQQALVSINVRSEYNQQKVRIAGFVVPITVDGQMVSEFFLVPYYGACIHVPPPPPNQMIFSRFSKSIKIDNIYYPYWVEGTLSTMLTENDLAISAYSLSIDSMSKYTEE